MVYRRIYSSSEFSSTYLTSDFLAGPVFETPCLRTAYCSLPLRTALAQPHEPPRGTSPCGSCADATMIERDCDGASWGSSITFAPRRCRERCAWCSTSDATKSQRRCRAVAQVHCASPRPPPPTHPLLLSIISLSSPRRVRSSQWGKRPARRGRSQTGCRCRCRCRRPPCSPPPPQDEYAATATTAVAVAAEQPPWPPRTLLIDRRLLPPPPP